MTFRRPDRTRYKGSGLLSSLGNAAGTVINKAIDLLPVEIHAPGGYQYCGPGSNLSKILARGDLGINKLDAACKRHDMLMQILIKDNQSRAEADRALADRAWERVKASDSSLGEKDTAWLVTNIMKAKRAIGGGRCKTGKLKKKNKPNKKKNVTIKKRNRSTVSRGKGLYLKPYTGSGQKNKKKKRRKI